MRKTLPIGRVYQVQVYGCVVPDIKHLFYAKNTANWKGLLSQRSALFTNQPISRYKIYYLVIVFLALKKETDGYTQ